MSLADALGLAALVVALIGIVVAAYYGRRALRPPKRKLEWDFVAEELFPQGIQDWRRLVEVRVSDKKVDNPHFATLSISNVGREDIPSALFDGGRPIEFEVAGKVASLLPLSLPRGVKVEGSRVLVGPELLRSGHRWSVRMIADGRPQARLVSSYLIDSTVEKKPFAPEEDGRNGARREARRSVRAAYVSAAAGILAALAAGFGSYFAAMGGH